MPEPDKYFIKAQKDVQRSRHQLIITLARQNQKPDDIKAIVGMIDWTKEIDWLAEEAREKEKNPAPTPVPIPPAPAKAPEQE